MRKVKIFFFACILTLLTLTGCGNDDENVIVLRVNNWEEYIDEGDWEEGDEIELSDGRVIFSVTGMVEDFEEWFYEVYNLLMKASSFQ